MRDELVGLAVEEDEGSVVDLDLLRFFFFFFFVGLVLVGELVCRYTQR